MGRIGLRTVEEVQAFAEGIQAFPWVNWEGVDTHFSTAGGGDPAYVETQWTKWQELLTAVPDSVTVRHYANSAMGVWFKRQPVSSIERFGISMYGMHPKDERSSLPIDLQDKQIIISRAQGKYYYPANFMLVATMNPCPCGYLGDPEKSCRNMDEYFASVHAHKDGFWIKVANFLSDPQ